MHGNRALWIIDLRKGAADICAEAPQNFLLSFPVVNSSHTPLLAYYEHPASWYRRKSHYYRAAGCKHSDGLQSHMETQGDKHNQRLTDTLKVTYTIHTLIHTHGMDKLPNTHRPSKIRSQWGSHTISRQVTSCCYSELTGTLVLFYKRTSKYRTRLSVFLIFWQFYPLNMFPILSLNCS
jgi:hypothetical protein